jgi:hypothetical protein
LPSWSAISFDSIFRSRFYLKVQSSSESFYCNLKNESRV